MKGAVKTKKKKRKVSWPPRLEKWESCADPSCEKIMLFDARGHKGKFYCPYHYGRFRGKRREIPTRRGKPLDDPRQEFLFERQEGLKMPRGTMREVFHEATGYEERKLPPLEFWKGEEIGDWIEGEVVGKFEGQYGWVVKLDTSEDDEKGILVGVNWRKQIENLYPIMHVKPGLRVYVEYVEDIETAKGMMKSYQLRLKAPDGSELPF